MCDSVRIQAPAKVNLSLEVRGRRSDGYHELRTIMQAVDLRDEIRLGSRDDGRITLSCDAEDVPDGERNLAFRAAELLKGELGITDGVDIELLKRIPPGAGLGGGSSDCAATLRGLNVLWQGGLDAHTLENLGGELGSDVPFFVRGGTAVCTGRGEKVEQTPTRGPFHYVIVLPGFPVSTASVYARCGDSLTMTQGGYNNIYRALQAGNAEKLGSFLFNALEEPACREDARLAELKERMDSLAKQTRSFGRLLCGSGSSILSLHAGKKDAERAARIYGGALALRTEPVASLPDWGICGLLEREESSQC